MDRENAHLFEKFDDGARDSTGTGLPGELTIRRARLRDADALGEISAEREGGDAQEQSAAFRRALEDKSGDQSGIVMVAELEGVVAGFGKARYLDEAHGAGAVASPEGWYLTGVVVDPRFRRRGVGTRLTEERLAWISEKSSLAYYFSNARNRVSIALHQRFGFAEVARGAEFAGVTFAGGEGILFRLDLTGSELAEPPTGT